MGLVEKEANKECMENNEEGIELLIEILESVRANLQAYTGWLVQYDGEDASAQD